MRKKSGRDGCQDHICGRRPWVGVRSVCVCVVSAHRMEFMGSGNRTHRVPQWVGCMIDKPIDRTTRWGQHLSPGHPQYHMQARCMRHTRCHFPAHTVHWREANNVLQFSVGHHNSAAHLVSPRGCGIHRRLVVCDPLRRAAYYKHMHIRPLTSSHMGRPTSCLLSKQETCNR